MANSAPTFSVGAGKFTTDRRAAPTCTLSSRVSGAHRAVIA